MGSVTCPLPSIESVCVAQKKEPGSLRIGSSGLIAAPIAAVERPASFAARETAAMPDAADLSDRAPPPPSPPPPPPPPRWPSSGGFVSVNVRRNAAGTSKGLETVIVVTAGW